jgi:hypothetical protein
MLIHEFQRTYECLLTQQLSALPANSTPTSKKAIVAWSLGNATLGCSRRERMRATSRRLKTGITWNQIKPKQRQKPSSKCPLTRLIASIIGTAVRSHNFDCCSGTTSSRMVSRRGKSLVSFRRLRTTWDWRHGENILVVHMRIRSGPRWPDRPFHLHDRYMRLEHPENLVMAERSTSFGHLNQLHTPLSSAPNPDFLVIWLAYFYDPEDGLDMFLRNFGVLSTTYTAL